MPKTGGKITVKYTGYKSDKDGNPVKEVKK